MSRRPYTFGRSLPHACLALAVLLGGASRASGPDVPGLPYTNACGPIAVFVAMRCAGVPATLDETIKRCRWTDASMTSLETLLAALRASPEIEAEAVRLSPDQLARFVDRGGVAIVPVRRDSDRPEHAVCVIGTSGGGDLVYFDYPGLVQTMTPGALAEVWDGQALLASRKGLRRHPFHPAWLVLPLAAVAVSFRGVVGRARVPREARP